MPLTYDSQIIVSFISTAFVSMVAMILAYVNRGVPGVQYSRLDSMIVSKIEHLAETKTPETVTHADDVTGYQAFPCSSAIRFWSRGSASSSHSTRRCAA